MQQEIYCASGQAQRALPVLAYPTRNFAGISTIGCKHLDALGGAKIPGQKLRCLLNRQAVLFC